MVHGFYFHEASARFEGGFLVEMLVPMVSSMAVCNDDGKRFSDSAEGRGNSGFLSQGNRFASA
jgi:hypothetical protein